MALRLFGIVRGDTVDSAATQADGVSFISFRELSAVVGAAPEFSLDGDTATVTAEYQAVVDRLFRRGVVVPAPVGTLFRDEQVLLRWMELHFVAIREAMSFVEDRSAARVHICRKGSGDDDSGSDLAAAAADAFRSLRRRAVAAVPLRTEHLTGIVLSGAFLVDNELWKGFSAGVAEAEREYPHLEFNFTGPWAPYDFVRMQFGG